MTALAPSALPMVDPRNAALSTDAFARLVAQHQRAVCAVAFSALRDRAASEEIAQEAFLVAWKKLPSLAEPPKLPSWICGIARNLAKNERRKSARTDTSAELDAVPDTRHGPLETLLEAESNAIVERALQSLDETYGEPLVLFYRQDLSVREVAAALDISEVNAKQRISRGRAQLSERVQQIVEQSLKTTGPGAAFTAAVVGAAAALPQSAQAIPAAGVARTSGGVLVTWTVAGALIAALGIGAVSLSSRNPGAANGAVGVASVRVSSSELAQSSPPRATSVGAAPTHPSPGPYFRPKAVRQKKTASGAPPKAVAALHDQLEVALQKKVDLELREAKTGEVLRLLSDIAATPVLVRGSIAEEVSVNLHAVSLQHALDDTLEAANAVWDEVELLRVVGTPGAAGPALGGSKVDFHLVDIPFNDAVQAIGQALQLSVLVADDVKAKPVTVEATAVVAGDLMAQLVSGAGLRYEIVPAIEVRPADDDE